MSQLFCLNIYHIFVLFDWCWYGDNRGQEMSTAWNFAVLLFEFCYLLNFAHSKNMTKFCLEQTSRIKESETTLTSVNALSAIHCAGLCSLDELCLSGSFDSNWNHCVLDSSYNKQTEVSTQAVYFAKIKPPEGKHNIYILPMHWYFC